MVDAVDETVESLEQPATANITIPTAANFRNSSTPQPWHSNRTRDQAREWQRPRGFPRGLVPNYCSVQMLVDEAPALPAMSVTA